MLIRLLISLWLFTKLPGIASAECPDWNSLSGYLASIPQKMPSRQQAHATLDRLLQYEASLLQCTEKNDSLHVTLLLKMATLYYDDKEYTNGIHKAKAAISIATQNTPLYNLQTRGYYILAAFYKRINSPVKSMEAMDSCIAVSIRDNYCDVYTLAALSERTQYSFNRGDYRSAYETARLGESLFTQYNRADGESYGEFFSGWKINSLLALQEFENAIPLLQEKIRKGLAEPAMVDLSTSYAQLAQAAFETSDYELARNSFKQALLYDRANRNYLGCAQTLNNTGYYIYDRWLKNADAAIAYYQQALDCLQEVHGRDSLVRFENMNIYGNIAHAFAQKHDFGKAAFYYEVALHSLAPGSTEDDLVANKRIHASYVQYIPALLIRKVESAILQYQTFQQKDIIQSAIKTCMITDQLLDLIKAGQTEEQSKLQWRRDTRSLYEHAIEACHLGNEPGAALHFFEKSRAALLQDELKTRRMLSDEALIQIVELKRRILLLERPYQQNEPVPDSINKKLYNLKQELALWLQRSEGSSTNHLLGYIEDRTVSLPALQRYLTEHDQQLLQLFSGEEAVYALMITATDVRLKKIDKDAFESISRQYISFLSDPQALNLRFKAFTNCAEALYGLIFNNMPPAGKRIVVSSDGLHFPFESLVTSVAARPVYFLNDHAVSYTYSAQFLMNDYTVTTNQPDNQFMGMAPVQFPGRFSLPALQGSDVSLQKIANRFEQRNSYLLSNATRQNFLRNFSKYQIIQLYTHAAATSHLQEPVIYFADSALYLSELVNDRRPVTQLVVLSACETGNGKDYAGEGVFSFNRGFATLGIPAALANLWVVENKATYQLTELFYEHISRGLPTDIALQKAKLEYIRNGSRRQSLPYYWAALVLIGKTNIIVTDGENAFIWPLLSSITGLIILSFLISKIYRRYKTCKARIFITDPPVAGAG